MITYNHQNYIKDAIESVLIQETSFDYELVISNDNSPDDTHSIIEALLRSHPNKNRVHYIHHKQNLGMVQNSIDNLERCRGTYIAFCEGDDAWTDPLKLETQIFEMRKHPGCDMSFHPARVYSGKNRTDSIVSLESRKTRIFSASEVVKGGGEFCPTASLVITKDALSKLPKSFEDGPVGDYFMQIIGSLRGGALYVNKIMSLYRIHTECSWNSSLNELCNKRSFFEAYSKAIKKFSLFLNHEFSDEIHTEIRKHYKDISLLILKNSGTEEFESFYRTNVYYHEDTIEIKSLYLIGALTRSAALVDLVNRILFIHPNIIKRAFKKLLILRHLRREKNTRAASTPEAETEPHKVWLKN